MTLSRKVYLYAGSMAAAATLLAGGSTALATSALPTGDTNISPTGPTDASLLIGSLADKVIQVLLAIAGAVAVLFLIWYGIQYITSGGNADRLKGARAGIINAVIGIIVVVAAYFIIRLAVGVGNSVNTTY